MARTEPAVQGRCFQCLESSDTRNSERLNECERRPDLRAQVLPEQHSRCTLLPACIEVCVLTINKAEPTRLLFTGSLFCLRLIRMPGSNSNRRENMLRSKSLEQ